jgi:hypothetical protein
MWDAFFLRKENHRLRIARAQNDPAKTDFKIGTGLAFKLFYQPFYERRRPWLRDRR